MKMFVVALLCLCAVAHPAMARAQSAPTASQVPAPLSPTPPPSGPQGEGSTHEAATPAASTPASTAPASTAPLGASDHDDAVTVAASTVSGAWEPAQAHFPYRVLLPAEVELLIHQSLRREGVDVMTDARYSPADIAGLAEAIAQVCEDMDCLIAALATGFQETRWRPHLRGPAGECGFAQQTPRYADDIPELESLTNRERCDLIAGDQLVAVRQWHAKRAQKMARHGARRWPCYYNAGYVCTPQGQHYLYMHDRYAQMYRRLHAAELGRDAVLARQDDVRQEP